MKRSFVTAAASAIGVACAAASLASVASASADEAQVAACSPSAAILASPRAGAQEVQAKAINNRGDIVGFADANAARRRSTRSSGRAARRARSISACCRATSPRRRMGSTTHRVVFGLLYDRKERTFPFRWENGRMTVLKGPGGRLLHSDNPGSGGRNAINGRGEIAWTMIVGGNRRAVRWAPDGKATYLPALPGHTWTDAFGINEAGIVSGWSRKLPNEDGEENPVLWTRDGKIVATEDVRASRMGSPRRRTAPG